MRILKKIVNYILEKLINNHVKEIRFAEKTIEELTAENIELIKQIGLNETIIESSKIGIEKYKDKIRDIQKIHD